MKRMLYCLVLAVGLSLTAGCCCGSGGMGCCDWFGGGSTCAPPASAPACPNYCQ